MDQYKHRSSNNLQNLHQSSCGFFRVSAARKTRKSEIPRTRGPKALARRADDLRLLQKAGEEYAAALRLSKETVAALEAPMIPAEDYIRSVNGTA